MAASQTRKGAPAGGVDYEIEEEDEYYVTRPHTSARRYRQPVQRDTWDDYAQGQETPAPRRRTNNPAANAGGAASASRRVATSQSAPRKRRKRSPWLAICAGMLLMLLLVVGAGYFASWWQTQQDNMTYGMPRTYQTNAVVGHSDSANRPSHFIFMNLHSRVIVVEFPGGDSAHAIIYTGPVLSGANSDLTPITGEFRDANGDGRPDMLVHIQGQTVAFVNTGSKFRPLQPGEQITLPDN